MHNKDDAFYPISSRQPLLMPNLTDVAPPLRIAGNAEVVLSTFDTINNLGSYTIAALTICMIFRDVLAQTQGKRDSRKFR
jgi:hypothetical protein